MTKMVGVFSWSTVLFVVIILVSGNLYAQGHQAVSQQRALELYKQAKDLETRGEFAKELPLLKQVYEATPNMYVAYHLGLVLYKLGDCEGAKEYLSQLSLSKLPEKIRKDIQKMTFHCRLKALTRQHSMDAIRTMGVMYPLAPTRKLAVSVRDAAYKDIKSKWFVERVAQAVRYGNLSKVEGLLGFYGKVFHSSPNALREQVYSKVVERIVRMGLIKQAGQLIGRVFTGKLSSEQARKLVVKDHDTGKLVAWALQNHRLGLLDDLVHQDVLNGCKLAHYKDLRIASRYKKQCAQKTMGPALGATKKVSHVKSYRPYAYTTLGLALAGLGTGLYLLLSANNTLKDLGNNWANYSQKDLWSRQSGAYTKRRAGWAVTGVGIAAGITSVVLFIVEPKSKVKVNAFGSPNGAGFVVNAVF